MHDKTARVFSGLGVLVLVWIVVYWSWPVEEDGSSLPTNLALGVESPDDTPPTPPERFQPIPRSQSVAEDQPQPNREPEDGGNEFAPSRGVIPPEFESYIVQAGDSFERIARRFYGTTRRWDAIARANPGVSPNRLRVGQTLRIATDPDNIQGRPFSEGEGAESERTPAAAPAVIEYTVKRGDTLSGIAKAFYGSTRHVEFLFESNRDRLATKDDLRLGQVLLIEPLPEEAD